MAASGFLPHLPRGHVAAHQARKLRPTQARHLADVAPQQTPRPPPLPHVLLLAQQPLDPTVDFFPLTGLESYFLRGQKKLLNLLQAKLFCFVHADHRSSACLIPFRLILCLKHAPCFRLILHWKSLTLHNPAASFTIIKATNDDRPQHPPVTQTNTILSRLGILIAAGAMTLGFATVALDKSMDFGPNNPFYAPSTLPFYALPFDKIKDS